MSQPHSTAFMPGLRISAMHWRPTASQPDPYAVLRYGDADTMPGGASASLLLAALKQLSTTDPYLLVPRIGVATLPQR